VADSYGAIPHPIFYNTGNNSKPIGFQNRFDAFDKRKNNRGFEHENNFQEVNQQNSSTRFFFFFEVALDPLLKLSLHLWFPRTFSLDLFFFINKRRIRGRVLMKSTCN
jgi:hypothetical protein